MPISDVASLLGGAALGAPVSEILKLVIEEAKKVKEFKALSRDLASTMEILVPVLKDIESIQEGSNPRTGELKILIKTMQRAEELIRKCSGVRYNIFKRALYTREIERINHDFLSFCQVPLQTIMYRNQCQIMRSVPNVTRNNDLLSDTEEEFTDLFVVPQPETDTKFWLDRPFRELKRMLFEDREVVVVSAPYACGKTMLVTKLCHDADVKGKFKQIFFITVSKAPNVRLIVQRFIQHTGCKANEFANNLDSRLCIQQLLKELRKSGSILLVLDDLWPEDESLLDKFLIQLPDYKILVTSRSEFPRFGPTYHLEPLIDEDFKNLSIECAPQPNCQSCAKYDDHLQKIRKRCNWLPLAMNPPCSICNGCNSVIEHGRPVNVLGVLWHPECFCCDACHKPIAINEVENHVRKVSNSRGKFHKSCYREKRRPNCYVCKEKIPSTAYHEHPFWKEKYCPSHDSDGTAKCCSCERLEPKETNFVTLDDDCWLCPECMDSSVMDTYECQLLHIEIREFYEGLNMKVEKEFPLLLVEKQALNEAVEKENSEQDHHHKAVTRAICLSERQIIRKIKKGPRMGENNQLIDMITETQTVGGYEITAILIRYGLPRLLTGYILAHEMMHAWLRLNGYDHLNIVLEEGICQVLGHMWLESETYATDASEKGKCSGFGRKLVEFCKHQIETDDSLFGLGFKKVNQMMVSNHHNLKDTLKDIVNASKTIP